MALFLKILWDYRKAALYTLLAITLCVMAWRVAEWRQAFKELDSVKAQLVNERACAVDSECHKRAATLAEQARQESEARAQDALQAAQEAEAKARANAAEWRRKYQAALNTDPECAAWSSQPISCPL